MEVAEGFCFPCFFYKNLQIVFWSQLSSFIKFDHSFTLRNVFWCAHPSSSWTTRWAMPICVKRRQAASHQFGKGMEYYPGNFHEPTFPLKVTLNIELWLEWFLGKKTLSTAWEKKSRGLFSLHDFHAFQGWYFNLLLCEKGKIMDFPAWKWCCGHPLLSPRFQEGSPTRV